MLIATAKRLLEKRDDKFTKRGTDIIGISLDSPGEYDCYDQLSEIYPNLVACNDLNRLTGQLLGIIGKLL